MPTPIWVPNTAITVPVNLRYTDANGDPVTSLYPRDYLILVGQSVNTNITDIEDLQNCCSGNTAQIAVLTAAIDDIPPEYITPTIFTRCLTPSGSTILPIDEVLDMLVVDWCTYLNTTGSASALATAMAAQCSNLNSSTSFATPNSSMSGISGWRTTPTTIADTIANLWYTACDSRAGITRALAAVTPTCAQVIVDYQAAIGASGSTIDLYFNGYSFIPSGYSDGGSQIQIQDESGNNYVQTLNIVNQSVTPGPLSINLSGSTLLGDSTYTITVTSNVVNSSLSQTCIKTVIKTIPPTTNGSCCPVIRNYSASISGNTTIQLVSGLAFQPRFATITPKNSFTGGLLGDLNYSPYLSYAYGGVYINFLSAPSGSFDVDVLIYR